MKPTYTTVNADASTTGTVSAVAGGTGGDFPWARGGVLDRSIATALGRRRRRSARRSPVTAAGGRTGRRRADRRAWDRAARSKPCKLAGDRVLRGIVTVQAGAAVVPAADRRLAEGHLPRPGAAGVSREHLPDPVTGDNGTGSEEDRLSSVPATFTYIMPEELSMILPFSGWRISSRPKRSPARGDDLQMAPSAMAQVLRLDMKRLVVTWLREM